VFALVADALSERYAKALARGDLEIIDEVFTQDLVDKYQQSGEVIRGRQNLRAKMERRPGCPSERGPDLTSVQARAGDEHRVIAPLFTVVRVQGRGDADSTTLRVRSRTAPGGGSSSTSFATAGSPVR
jgi:hypothetical protein